MGVRATKTLGRYEILKHLAQGGMADVLLARTTGIEGFARHVVIKRIREEQVSDAQYIAMFLDEARLAAALHHHNVVQVHDIDADQGEFFFTMEYVHGEDARTLLTEVSSRDELVPLEHVISIVTGAAAGLHHAHEARGADRKPLGIVHRDVSPANILIGFDGCVKVADFGIAKAVERRAETQVGTLKGKVSYMSPEQCMAEAVDRRSDVFSLGIVLYELLTARRLYKGDTDFLTMTSIVCGNIPPPSTLRPDLPTELEDIVFKALASKPHERYQTAAELRAALERFAARAQLRTSAVGLAAYLRTLFGERPEPWLVEDEDDVEVSVDVDSSPSGVVASPVNGMVASSAAVAPLYRAPTVLEPEPNRRTAEQTGIGGAVAPITSPSHGALTPSVIVPVLRLPRAQQRRWLLGGAAAVVIAAVFVVIAATRPTPAQPASVAQPATPLRATPPIPPPAPAAVVPAPVAPVAAPPVVSPSVPERTVKRPIAKKPPAPAPKPAKRWDPDALFPR